MFLVALTLPSSLNRILQKFKRSLEGDVLRQDDVLVFDQIQDHFDNTNLKTFKQRYLVNTTFFDNNTGGPLFIFIGGEGELRSTSVTDKYSPNLFAEHFKGLVVGFEHRFYGNSFPEHDSSNLTLLSSRQALADYTTFIPFLKSQYKITKVIVVGGSYPGNMAAWLRMQFPFLIDGAIATSGPFLAQDDYPEYFDHVFAQLDGKCRDFVFDVMKYVQTQVDSSNIDDHRKVIDAFKIDKHTDFSKFTELDKGNMISNLVGFLAGLVQYALAKDYNGTYKGDIETQCEGFSSFYDSQIDEKLKGFASFNIQTNVDQTYEAMVKSLLDTSVGEGVDSSGRSWMWQTCTEFGYYQTIDKSKYGFSVPVDIYHKMCYDAYFKPLGISEDETDKIILKMMQESNIWYHARNIPTSNIFFTNGGVDPWSELSVKPELQWKDGQNICDDCKNIVITYGSHCTDMYSAWTINDDIRQQQIAEIEKWLKL